jgi:hypothetical protein
VYNIYGVSYHTYRVARDDALSNYRSTIQKHEYLYRHTLKLVDPLQALFGPPEQKSEPTLQAFELTKSAPRLEGRTKAFDASRHTARAASSRRE